MTAEIVTLNAEAERFALAERLGLDPDTELRSLPFSGDPQAACRLGFLMRNSMVVPLDFLPASGDLAVYIGRGVGAAEVASLTGLRQELVEAFFAGYGPASG